MRKVAGVLLVLTMVLSVLAGCGGSKQESAPAPASGAEAPKKEEKLKVAFVYVGPIGDAGWTWAHDQGRLYLEKQLGSKVETSYIESVPEGADAERVFEELAQKGNKVIFGTSFGYMDAMLAVAQRHPDVRFFHATGYKTAANMSTYFGRAYQARYLTGIVAGLQTKKNQIGYVAAFPIPEVVRGINAFTLGVRSVNPNATVKVVWTNTWYDPAKEKDAAKSLLDVGVDLIAMHQDTPGPLQAAEERGAFGVGYNSDMSKFAPKAFLTAPVWNWGPYYVRSVESVMNNTFKSEQYWGPMKDGIIDIAPIAAFAHPDAKAKVETVKKQILDGSWDVFTGPIKDQTGKVRVEAGKRMTDAEMLSFDWFVEGVEGKLQ
ncbi:MAG: BMP family ABC transporter substrate-binding protein [Bacillota bacterium]